MGNSSSGGGGSGREQQQQQHRERRQQQRERERARRREAEAREEEARRRRERERRARAAAEEERRQHPVLEPFTHPTELYDECEWRREDVARRVYAGDMAPRWRGVEEEDAEEVLEAARAELHRLDPAAATTTRASTAATSEKASGNEENKHSNEGVVAEGATVKAAGTETASPRPPVAPFEECPICFLCYPDVNCTQCCAKAICSECFLQVQAPAGTSDCPYCNAEKLAILYAAPGRDTATERARWTVVTEQQNALLKKAKDVARQKKEEERAQRRRQQEHDRRCRSSGASASSYRSSSLSAMSSPALSTTSGGRSRPIPVPGASSPGQTPVQPTSQALSASASPLGPNHVFATVQDRRELQEKMRSHRLSASASAYQSPTPSNASSSSRGYSSNGGANRPRSLEHDSFMASGRPPRGARQHAHQQRLSSLHYRLQQQQEQQQQQQQRARSESSSADETAGSQQQQGIPAEVGHMLGMAAGEDSEQWQRQLEELMIMEAIQQSLAADAMTSASEAQEDSSGTSSSGGGGSSSSSSSSQDAGAGTVAAISSAAPPTAPATAHSTAAPSSSSTVQADSRAGSMVSTDSDMMDNDLAMALAMSLQDPSAPPTTAGSSDTVVTPAPAPPTVPTYEGEAPARPQTQDQAAAQFAFDPDWDAVTATASAPAPAATFVHSSAAAAADAGGEGEDDDDEEESEADEDNKIPYERDYLALDEDDYADFESNEDVDGEDQDRKPSASEHAADSTNTDDADADGVAPLAYSKMSAAAPTVGHERKGASNGDDVDDDDDDEGPQEVVVDVPLSAELQNEQNRLAEEQERNGPLPWVPDVMPNVAHSREARHTDRDGDGTTESKQHSATTVNVGGGDGPPTDVQSEDSEASVPDYDMDCVRATGGVQQQSLLSAVDPPSPGNATEYIQAEGFDPFAFDGPTGAVSSSPSSTAASSHSDEHQLSLQGVAKERSFTAVHVQPASAAAPHVSSAVPTLPAPPDEARLRSTLSPEAQSLLDRIDEALGLPATPAAAGATTAAEETASTQDGPAEAQGGAS